MDGRGKRAVFKERGAKRKSGLESHGVPWCAIVLGSRVDGGKMTFREPDTPRPQDRETAMRQRPLLGTVRRCKMRCPAGTKSRPGAEGEFVTSDGRASLRFVS